MARLRRYTPTEERRRWSDWQDELPPAQRPRLRRCRCAIAASAQATSHGEEEDHPHHPAGAHADARAGSAGARAATSRRWPAATRSRRRCARPSAACMCPDQPCVRGCPVGIDIPGFIQKIGEQGLPRRLRRHHRHQPAARGLRPRLPAGEPVRRRRAPSGETLEPVAIGRLERFVGDIGDPRGLGQRARTSSRTASRSASSAPARRAWPAPPTWPRPAARSRSSRPSTTPGGVLKYGIPDFRLPNAVIDAEIDKLAQARRQLRVQHAGRAAVHHRADDHRDGLRRRVHRHRRRLSDDSWASPASR